MKGPWVLRGLRQACRVRFQRSQVTVVFSPALRNRALAINHLSTIFMAAWRNGNASDYDRVIRRLQVRPLRWSIILVCVAFLWVELHHPPPTTTITLVGASPDCQCIRQLHHSLFLRLIAPASSSLPDLVLAMHSESVFTRCTSWPPEQPATLQASVQRNAANLHRKSAIFDPGGSYM